MTDIPITVIGYVGQTPTLYVANSGTTWTSIRVASTRRKQTPDGWVDGPTLWFTARAYGEKAQNVVDSISKGTPVVVVGRLALEEYDLHKTDNPLAPETVERRVTQVVENATIAVDISKGVAKWQRVVHNQQLPPDAPAYAKAPEPETENQLSAEVIDLEREFTSEPVAA